MIIVNPNHKCPSPVAALMPPIWCAYLADYYDADEILDAEVEGLSLEETVDRIGDSFAVIVAMGVAPSSSSTPKVDVTMELSKLCNSTYAGLHWGTGIPEPKVLAKLKPRWDLIDFSKYKAHNWHCLHDLSSRDNYGVIFTSFGCPFNCSYCNIHFLYKTRKVEFRKPEDVLTEIDYLVKEKGIRNLKIADELFVLNKNHVNAICDGLIERDYGLNICAFARVDTVNPEILDKLKRAGFNWLIVGFEGVVLAGEKYNLKVANECAYMIHQAGINILGNFMFGLPGDSLRSMIRTLEWSWKLRCEWVNFYCTMAYPGSKLYDETPKELLPDTWSDYDQYSPNAKPLPTKSLTQEAILAFRDLAFDKYFTNPDYRDMIKDKFGQQAVDHIKEMLSWKPRASEIHSLTASSS